ncbi:MAG TPA: dihydrofolate reductase family protein [Verrucomicrobiae bacterium]|jgi:riboflavin-specific deaminase-like protein|nr:dihydrofolate reductase family protein [Verrucomicrobiae bacterium]
MKRGALPFVFVNAAMTADGKLAPYVRHFEPFAGPRDREHLLELRATADAVMAGARTVDLDRVNMGPGPARFRRKRLKRGLAEYNLRIIVSGSGTIDTEAEIFRHRFSPIVILTTERVSPKKLRQLRSLADEVKVIGKRTVDFKGAFGWLREKWNVRRLLCEGGGEVNGAVFRAGLVDELHLTIAPVIFGGRTAPTLADGPGVDRLADGARLRLVSMTRIARDLYLVYRRGD